VDTTADKFERAAAGSTGGDGATCLQRFGLAANAPIEREGAARSVQLRGRNAQAPGVMKGCRWRWDNVVLREELLALNACVFA
jgi:hypothetical protein